MRFALPISLLILAAALLYFLTPTQTEMFEDRFDRADQRIEAMAKDIETQLDEAAPDR